MPEEKDVTRGEKLPLVAHGDLPRRATSSSVGLLPEPTETAARHSCDSPEWYSPTLLVKGAREVMGGIDLDPASHEEANTRLQVPRFYSKEENGLLLPWFGRVFHNPPGGLVGEFWKKALKEWERGHFEQMIWIGYSLEQLQTLQQCGAASTPLDFPTCFTSKRIAFVENGAKKAERIAKLLARGKKPNPNSSPSHSNYITYFGRNTMRFVSVFGRFGQVVIK